MSIHHENIAWHVEMPGLKKIVLLFIARSAHLNTLEGHMSIQRIAVECGVSESAARKSVGELAKEGYFVSLGGYGRGVHYRLTLPTQEGA